VRSISAKVVTKIYMQKAQLQANYSRKVSIDLQITVIVTRINQLKHRQMMSNEKQTRRFRRRDKLFSIDTM
jgi:hypothetical protein